MTEDRLSSTFAALADPTRRAILASLALGERSVNEIAAPFAISLPAVSKHLKVLERAGLIARSKEAQWRPCRLEAGPLKDVDRWLAHYRKFWEESLDRLDGYLRTLQKKNRRRRKRSMGDARAEKPSAGPMEREVVITRVFDAPRALVFAAWTDPKHLAQWWGPRGFTNPVCAVDLHVGGALHIVMRAPDGAEHPMKGIFQEVVPPERLVFSNIAVDAAGETLLEGVTRVTFTVEGTKTRLTITTRAVGKQPIAAMMLQGMELGWTQSIDKLEDYTDALIGKKKETKMQVNPYLTFNGNCEEAFKFYADCLKGKIAMMMPHAGTPAAEHVPANWANKIIHARMTVGEWVLMGSDAPPDRYRQPQGMSVSLGTNSVDEADRVFKALAEKGNVQMPIQKTFWAARFGMVTDRFGIPWMINCEG